MKEGLCPKCAGTEILRVANVTDQIGEGTTGLVQDAFVCGTCGLIELYARDLDAVRAVAERVRAGGAGGPFRG